MATFSREQRHGRLNDNGRSQTDFFRTHGYSPAPRLVQSLITYDCPLSCSHCLAGGCDTDETIMPLGLFESVASQVASLNVPELLLTGGEPLSHPELPAIIESLRKHNISWTLNTAAMPDSTARKALESCPPSFVAVSLDGPALVHDSFRGLNGSHEAALESIQYFSGLADYGVAAGTTVTAMNFPCLEETFNIVIASGASSWGIHLLVPEGRARTRPDLFLSRSQLKELLSFVAAKRNHFEVTFADEMGYCGAWEALIRPQPFFCGAGLTHCVILPDGTVVPCSTCDTTASVGNIRHMPLADIWEHGFQEQRGWTPKNGCSHCRFASACKGGCWLQRRNGSQCFKDVWTDIPMVSQAGQAALLAISLGLSVAIPQGSVAENTVNPSTTNETTRIPSVSDTLSPTELGVLRLEKAIMLREGDRIRHNDRDTRWQKEKQSLKDDLVQDPAVAYFLLWDDGKAPKDLTTWAQAAEKALQTDQRSLSLICLLWWNAMEICLDGNGPEKRTQEETAALRKGMALLKATGDAWHREIILRRLDPFLRTESANAVRHAMMCKAQPPPSTFIAYDVAGQRGFATGVRGFDAISPMSISNTLANAVPFGSSMDLSYQSKNPSDTKIIRSGQTVAENGRLTVFDILAISGEATTITIPITSERAGASQKTATNTPAATIAAPDNTPKVSVNLPARVELSYADLLLLTCNQNPQQAFVLLERNGRMRWRVTSKNRLGDDVKQILKTRLGQLYLF